MRQGKSDTMNQRKEGIKKKLGHARTLICCQCTRSKITNLNGVSTELGSLGLFVFESELLSEVSINK